MFDFTVVVLEDAFPSGFASSRDVLATARQLAPRLGLSGPVWRFCSPQGGLIRLQGDMLVDSAPLPDSKEADRSTWILPGLGLATSQAIESRLGAMDVQQLLPRLKQHVDGGGRLAASCSSVFLLQAAGLLEGRRVTTTWWLAPYLQRLSPGCKVEADRVLCVDGPLTTGGTAFAHVDLMMHLLKETKGAELADLVARMLLIEGKQAQGGFIVPEILAAGDALLTRLTRLVESRLPEHTDLATLAASAGMSGRSLSRHIRRATGRTPLDLVQSIKLRRAKHLLETSRLNIEDIAAAVGYGDATALRRMLKRKLGAGPKALRK